MRPSSSTPRRSLRQLAILAVATVIFWLLLQLLRTSSAIWLMVAGVTVVSFLIGRLTRIEKPARRTRPQERPRIPPREQLRRRRQR